MRTFVTILICRFILTFGTPVVAAEDQILKNLKLVCLQRVQVVPGDGEPFLEFTFEIDNKNDFQLTISDYDLTVKIGEVAKGQPIPIGKIIPGKLKLEAKSKTSVSLPVSLGTIDNALGQTSTMLNFLGDPTKQFRILVTGRATFSKDLKMGWARNAWQAVHLEFWPKIRRKVLLE